MNGLAVQPRDTRAPSPRLTIDLAAVARNTGRLAAAATGEPDGGGEGRRLRPRSGRRGAHRPRARRHAARGDHARGGRGAAGRRARRTGPQAG
ncbi:hypothetical protein [Nocardioides convexus]|uniref:hypothetical protein n=1 Tax=Nocardioides convexus TaxID=2712224 RepID=UPI002418ABFD|nr:hypothetical protein [Nocardioides convexus]